VQYGICDVITLSGLLWIYSAPLPAKYGCDFISIVPDNGALAFVKYQNGDIAGCLADPGMFDINLPLSTVLSTGQANAANNRLSRWHIQTQVQAGLTVKQNLVNVIKELDAQADFMQLKLSNNT
jgi:hypothetical protein